MKMLQRRIIYQESVEIFRLYHLTDLHLGAAACDETLLKTDIDRIARDERAMWIGGGDYIDAICRAGDRRYHQAMMADWLKGRDDVMGLEVDYTLELLQPIAGKCLALVKGNHERAAEIFYDRSVYWEIVKGLAQAAGKPPEDLALGVNGFIRISFRKGTEESNGMGWTFIIYTHHGFGSGTLPGSPALALGRCLNTYNANLIFMGHRHLHHILPQTVVNCTQYGVHEETRLGAFVPGYLSSYIRVSDDKAPIDTYTEEHGLRPSMLGTIETVVTPYDHSFKLLTEIRGQ